MIDRVSKFKLMLYLAAIFAAGGVSGWVVAAKTTKQKIFSPPAPKEFSSRFCDRVFSSLDLSDDQKQKVREIGDRYDKDMFKLHAQHGRQIRQAVSNRNAQLSAILKPEQFEKFEEIERQRRESSRTRSGDRNRDRDGDRDRSKRDKPPRENSTNNASGKPPC
jgi:Spy/CpxP family protein refolding chaperone